MEKKIIVAASVAETNKIIKEFKDGIDNLLDEKKLIYNEYGIDITDEEAAALINKSIKRYVGFDGMNKILRTLMVQHITDGKAFKALYEKLALTDFYYKLCHEAFVRLDFEEVHELLEELGRSTASRALIEATREFEGEILKEFFNIYDPILVSVLQKRRARLKLGKTTKSIDAMSVMFKAYTRILEDAALREAIMSDIILLDVDVALNTKNLSKLFEKRIGLIIKTFGTLAEEYLEEVTIDAFVDTIMSYILDIKHDDVKLVELVTKAAVVRQQNRDAVLR